MTVLFAASSSGDPPPAKLVAHHNLESDEAHAAGAAKEVFFGDAGLRGKVDLRRMKKTDAGYEVPLDGKARALLTLDPKLQEAADKVLERAKAPYGAVVVLAVDGRILALAGRSNAEPALSIEDLTLKPWAPAASIFKVVTSAALLEKGVGPDEKVCFHGGIRSVLASNLVDDPRRDRACETLAYGLSRSQNAIMAKLAARHLDKSTLEDAARRFGFGAAPDFALPAEASTATIPDDPLEFARTAAGFWNTHLSPLEGALVAHVVATGGLRVEPRIVAQIVTERGHTEPILAPAPRRVLDEQAARALADMMTDTVRWGTARKAFYDHRGRSFLGGVEVAGKTGSLSRNDPYLHYSWFVGFAPADQPQVVIAVLVGNSPLWHLKAHTAARLVLEAVSFGTAD